MDEKTPVEATVELTESIAGHSDRLGELVDALNRSNDRFKNRIKIIIGVFVIFVIIIAGIGMVTQQQYSTCKASNDSRAGQVILWHDKILPIFEVGASPNDQKTINSVDDYVKHLFKQRNCSPFKL